MNVIAPRCWNGDDDDAASEIDVGFLQKIIPDDGVTKITKIGDTVRNDSCSDLTDMADRLGRLDKTSANVYHACASFRDGENRRADNVKSLKALYLDLDCGEGKASTGSGYATQLDALEALRDFCEKCDLPRPLIVDSGGGIHAYWPFKAPVSAGDWKPVAERLKELCRTCDLQADPSVTADAARILRPVGTHNKKYDPPRRVSLLCDKGPYEFETLRNLINAAAGGCFLTPFKVREGNGTSTRVHKEMQENAKAVRCAARCRATKERCWNPAAFGMATCRYHGARRRQTVRTGPDHPKYKHGQETLVAKRKRSEALARLAEYEEMLVRAGKLTGPRTPGPKPG